MVEKVPKKLLKVKDNLLTKNQKFLKQRGRDQEGRKGICVCGGEGTKEHKEG